MSILRKNLAKDYALTLSWRYAEVQLLGLPNLKDARVLRLENIYVPLRLCRDWADRFDKKKTVYVPKALQEQRHIIVLGDPGSGKSTLIKILTYAFGEAESNAYKRACGELIPIPIILREYKTQQWRSYKDLLRDFIATLDEDMRNEITAEWLLEHLREGRAILLIDGLDEVGPSEERLRLRDKIIFPLLLKSHRSYALLTSRLVGYEEVSFDFTITTVFENREDTEGTTELLPLSSSFNRFYVSPFNEEEIAQFITRWYQLRETFTKKQREGIDALMSALNQNERIRRLAHNPQLLTLIALIHRVRANLPSGRVELYNKIVEAYLETIQVYRKLGTPAKLDEMKHWLAKVGWEMQIRRDEELTQSAVRRDDLIASRAEINHWLVEAITKGRGQDGSVELAEHFLDYVAKRSGFLVPVGPEQFSFVHLTFQEYFAAFELRGQLRKFDKLAETCSRLAAKSHWHETLNLLFEMLTEFPGASEDLFDEMVDRAKLNPNIRGGAAKLFSTLLLDEQSGLSFEKQREVIDFTLTEVCSRYEEGIVNDLQALSHDQNIQLVEPWFSQRLSEADLPIGGECFFIVGAELLQNWPRQLSQWITSKAYRRPSDLQVAEIALIVASDEKSYYQLMPWAIENVPINLWLRRISRGFGDEGGLTLADIYRRALYTLSFDAQQHLLLLEFSIALAITKSLILRSVLATLDHVITHENSPYYRNYHPRRTKFSKYLHNQRNEPVNDVLRRAATRAGERVLPRDLARTFALDLAIDGSSIVEREMASALSRESSATEHQLHEPTTQNNRLSILIAAERALYAPDVLNGNLIVELQSLTHAQDDWSRLLSYSALLALGKGTPDLCNERNLLVDKGIKHSAQFSFYEGLRTETQKKGFSQKLPELFYLLFQEDPKDPWLRPELFDTAKLSSKYFLSSSREFLAIAAEVLDRRSR